ncbi:MAG: cytochrome P450 [Gemmatimonadaceae bacterium]
MPHDATVSLGALPPGPRASLPGRHVLRMVREPLDFLTELARTYGDVVRFRLGGEEMYLVSHPEAIRDVLVTQQRSFKKGRALERARVLLGNGLLTSEGDFHLRQRRLMQPAFHRQRIAAYAQTMVEYARRRSQKWTSGDTIDVHADMMALTLAIVGKTLFDADVEGEARDIGDALNDAFSAFRMSAFLPLGQLLQWLPLPASIRFRRGRSRLEQTIYRVLAERRTTGADTGDLLSMLLQARDTEGDGTGMTDRQIRDEALTLFIAGHETTAVALSWTWYLLAQHPEIEARWHRELDRLPNTPLTADTLLQLPYTRQLLTEAMRLFPPAWIIGRRALEDVVIGGFRIPANGIVLMSQWIVHRDARWFPDPERFDPDRWAADAPTERFKFSYFPFGGGARVCIGEPFAWMEGILVLATIGQRWRFRSSGETVPPRPIITLRPKSRITMRVEARRT